MFHVEHIILWWGVGIIHTPPSQHTFNTTPLPPSRSTSIIHTIIPPPTPLSIML